MTTDNILPTTLRLTCSFSRAVCRWYTIRHQGPSLQIQVIVALPGKKIALVPSAQGSLFITEKTHEQASPISDLVLCANAVVPRARRAAATAKKRGVRAIVSVCLSKDDVRKRVRIVLKRQLCIASRSYARRSGINSFRGAPKIPPGR
jgi:hypothetical protein